MTATQQWLMAALLALGLGIALRLSALSSQAPEHERRDDALRGRPPASTPMLPATSLPTIVADDEPAAT